MHRRRRSLELSNALTTRHKSLHRRLTIQRQYRQTSAFRVMHGLQRLEEAESLLEVEVGAAKVGSTCSRIVAIDYISVTPVEQPHALKCWPLFPGDIYHPALHESIAQ